MMRRAMGQSGVVKVAAAVCAGVLLVANSAAVSAGPWWVLYDQGDTSAPGGITALHTLALSSDSKYVYTGWIQWGVGTVRQFDAQATGSILNSYSLGSIQARSVATDDRGNVYIGYGLNGNGQMEIRNATLTTQVAAPFDGGRTSFVEGLRVLRSGSTYYLYASRADGVVQRFDVTTASAPALDTGWATGGTYTVAGAGALRGIAVATDGTFYVAQRDTTGGDRKGFVYAVDPTLTFQFSAAVDGAMDVAVQGVKLFVTQYLAYDNAIAVLDPTTLALVDTLHTGFEKDVDNGSHGYTGIDVAADGSLYVGDEWYSMAGLERDRILTTFEAGPPPTGSAKVTIAPPDAAAKGGKWQVDGGGWQDSDAVVSKLAVGTHAIDCKAIAGWTSPPRQWVDVKAGDTALATATYVEEPPGSLQVTLGPSAAIAAGAAWRLLGGTWQKDGATVSGLMPGKHAVGYKAVSGWIAPPSEWVTIASGEAKTLSSFYTPVAGRKIAGLVKDASGKGIPNVSVYARMTKAAPGQAYTAPDGTFLITGLAPGSFTVTPLLPGLAFTPASKVVNVKKADAPGVTFIGKPDAKEFCIYGYVLDSLGAPVSGAQLAFTGGLRSVKTSSSGYYQAAGALDGSKYTVTAAAKGLILLPPAALVAIAGASQRADFRATSATGSGVTLVSISVQGPAGVNGGDSADYDCIAKYSDNTSEPVDPVWTATSTAATIDGTGKLTTSVVTKNTPCLVAAKFSKGGVTRTAQKPATVLPVGPAGGDTRLAAIEVADDSNPGRSSTTELQMVCAAGATRNATLTALKLEAEAKQEWASGEPKWAGAGLGSLSGETVGWSAGKAGTINASAGGNSRQVSLKLFLPQNTNVLLTPKSPNASNLVDILRKVARYTGADPAKSVAWTLKGNVTSAMVNKYKDPLCARKWNVVLEGDAAIGGKTAIPGARLALGKIATIGPYFTSTVAMSYKVTGAGYDPSQASPWTAVADHLTLGGTLTLGVQVVTPPRDKAYQIDVKGTASVAVAGTLNLEANDSAPVLTGQAAIDAADLPVDVTISLYGREIYTYSHTWHLWDAASIPSASGVLFRFSTLAPKN